MTAMYKILENSINLTIKVQPKSKKPGIQGQTTSKTGDCLKIGVSEPAEGGKANQAVVKILSKALSIPMSNINIIIGQTSRDKAVNIIGNIEELIIKLNSL